MLPLRRSAVSINRYRIDRPNQCPSPCLNHLPSAVLETPRLRLRALLESDAEALHQAYGDAETMRFWDAPASRDVAEKPPPVSVARAASVRTSSWHAAFAVTLREDDRVVGMVNYHDRRPWTRRLAVGWILARPWWRQGLMREAVPALLRHCFNSLDAHRIEARIEPNNIASIRLAERIGFLREGLMREWMFVGGEPRSLCLYALLRTDWASTDGA